MTTFSEKMIETLGIIDNVSGDIRTPLYDFVDQYTLDDGILQPDDVAETQAWTAPSFTGAGAQSD